MSSQKNQPTEFSKLLKDNETPQIVYQDRIYKKTTFKNKILSWIINKINAYFPLIILIMLFVFGVIIYWLLESIREKREMIYDYDKEYERKFIDNYYNDIKKNKTYKKVNITNLYNETKMCTENKQFAILSRTNCEACGLFSYYIVHLGCIITYLDEGYIPIIDVGSFSNVFNGYNETYINDSNPWELFFNQPCGYSLNQVKQNPNNIIKYFECECNDNMPSEKEVYSNQTLLKYYRDIANKYMSVKKGIIDESNILWNKLFNNSTNVLGILARGTDYTSIHPSGHSIPASAEKSINDTKIMDEKYKYDYYFLATEDNNIREKFKKEFKDKVKFLLPEKIFEYDYEDANYLTYYQEVFGNLKYQKTYLMSMILFSKCVDVITSRTSGAAGGYILSKGFRHDLVYYLGEYS